MSPSTAPGTDGVTHPDAVDTFATWAEPMLQAVHRHGYHLPAVWRVWIPKPGKAAKRPFGVPGVTDRALQRCTAGSSVPFMNRIFSPVGLAGARGEEPITPWRR